MAPSRLSSSALRPSMTSGPSSSGGVHATVARVALGSFTPAMAFQPEADADRIASEFSAAEVRHISFRPSRSQTSAVIAAAVGSVLLIRTDRAGSR